MTDKSILILDSVHKTFGGIEALRDLTLSISPGQVYGLIGPNGAGKTTVFNLITGVYPCTQGQIKMGTRDLTRLKPHQIVRLGLARTFQTIRLFANLTTWEHVWVAQNRSARSGQGGIWPFRRAQERILRGEAEEILTLLGLWEVRSHKASTLPYGTQRKVEIARALAIQPKIMLLDEPAAGLNPQETEDLLKTLNKIYSLGKTILIIEHDMRVIMGLCQHIFVLNFGEKIAEGTPDQIRRNEQVIEAYLGKEG